MRHRMTVHTRFTGLRVTSVTVEKAQSPSRRTFVPRQRHNNSFITRAGLPVHHCLCAPHLSSRILEPCAVRTSPLGRGSRASHLTHAVPTSPHPPDRAACQCQGLPSAPCRASTPHACIHPTARPYSTDSARQCKTAVAVASPHRAFFSTAPAQAR